MEEGIEGGGYWRRRGFREEGVHGQSLNKEPPSTPAAASVRGAAFSSHAAASLNPKTQKHSHDPDYFEISLKQEYFIWICQVSSRFKRLRPLQLIHTHITYSCMELRPFSVLCQLIGCPSCPSAVTNTQTGSLAPSCSSSDQSQHRLSAEEEMKKLSEMEVKKLKHSFLTFLSEERTHLSSGFKKDVSTFSKLSLELEMFLNLPLKTQIVFFL